MSDDTVQEVLDAASVPTDDGDPVFNEAWQARIFGLAVAMRGQGGVYEWKSFQQRLSDEIAAAEGATDEAASTPDAIEDEYYHQWMSALERLLIERGHVDKSKLRRRTVEFMEGERTAAEFVEGEHHHDEEHNHHDEEPHRHGSDSSATPDTDSDVSDNHGP
jgi:nitrile hydratase accessory protein